MDIIGRLDKIDIPELNLMDIDAKIDTGAYGSALHCHHIEVVNKDGKEVLAFEVLDPTHPEYEGRLFYAEKFVEKTVKNSGGIAEDRFAITTDIIIFNQTIEVEFSLTDRQNMNYPVLLGRKFLSKRFIVDVNRKNLSYKQKKAK